MRVKENRIYYINAVEIFIVVAFTALVGITIYFISKGIGSTDIKLEVTKAYSVDQANAIKTLADSTVGKINNTIAVSAIFFTVVVAAISVFQFLKIKEIDGIKESLLLKIKENDCLEKELSKEIARIKCEFNSIRIRRLEEKEGVYDFGEIRRLAKENIDASKKHVDLFSGEEIQRFYETLGNAYFKVSQYNEAKKNYFIALNTDSDEYAKASIYKSLVKIARYENENNDIKANIKKLKEIYNDGIGLELRFLINIDRDNDICKFKKVIDTLKEIKYIYGEEARELIKKAYSEGDFKNLDNSHYKNDLHEIMNK